jgi:hypothetical protein
MTYLALLDVVISALVLITLYERMPMKCSAAARKTRQVRG